MKYGKRNTKRRVVGMGLGLVAANGIGVSVFWQTLIEPRSDCGPIALFDASPLSNRIAAEVRGSDPRCHVPVARRSRIEHALITVHGMGGGNASRVFRRPPL